MQKILAIVAALCALIAGTFLGTKAIANTQETSVARCSSDDGSGARPCIWVADEQGNGKGMSFFVDKRGNVRMIDNP